MYLELCDIANCVCKFNWAGCSRRRTSSSATKTFSQRVCKFNMALNELQVALWLGKRMSRGGVFSCNYDLFNSPELIFQQGPSQAEMAAVTTPYFRCLFRHRLQGE
jgi:hypothetical protein